MTHQKQQTTVLMVNLGTPDAPTYGAVRRYLKEFLWDKRVVDTFRPLWWMILNLIILVFRPFKAGKAYRTVWNHYGPDTGSPLMHISKNQQQALQQALDAQGHAIVVKLAMSYGNPNIRDVMSDLEKQGTDKLIVLPMYPQYSATTTAAVHDAVGSALRKWRSMPEVILLRDFHTHPSYITALSNSIVEHQATHGVPERLVYSFHGIPVRYCDEGDTYRDEVYATSKALNEALAAASPNNTPIQTFQSRVGREEWLNPYTDDTMEKLAAEGVKSVQLVCPGFSADCLETIEEIDEENRELFINGGGVEFSYIPALNDREDHINALVDVLTPHLVNAA